MVTPYTTEEDVAIVREWMTVSKHFEDALIFIDETSEAFWNHVRIVFVASDGNRNGRSMKLIKKRFEQIFPQLDAFKDEMEAVKENNLNMTYTQRWEMVEAEYEVVYGKKFELQACYHVVEESTYGDFFHYY